MSDLDLAVIGNCSFGALIDRRARIVWSCLPRFDSEPVFCALLDGDSPSERGIFAIDLVGHARSQQTYRRNSAVLVTTLSDESGGAIEITDFAPRFKSHGRTFRPMMIVRQVRPLAGTPRICVRLRPTYDHGEPVGERTRGSNHVRYVMPNLTLRLSTDCPVTYVMEEVPFVLDSTLTLILGPDESLTGPIGETGRHFLEETDDYWREWCRYLSLPFEWQDAVIRAAITLKLSNYEETGAIIAAMTTSIPEAPRSGRNWDYRYCWLRDSYFVVRALNRLGVTRTMEGYLNYITNIVVAAPDGYLAPVFAIDRVAPLAEREIATLAGYRGHGPVRVGNNAATQIQNDGYGSVILASAQSYFDRRVLHPGELTLFKRLEVLGNQAVARWDQPDAGLWEYRTRVDVHTFSSAMCWAACDRLARIAAHLRRPDREAHWRRHAERVGAAILERAWNPSLRAFTATFGGEDIDASVLLLHDLGLVAASDPRFASTLALVEQRLRRGKHVLRYSAPDDFGVPETAFNICTFWYVDGLAAVGRVEEARDLFENMLACRNSLGLLSEDLDPRTGELWGNFPQTFSMVGLINSALRLSRPWENAF